MKRIVVARFNEDVAWANHLPRDWTVDIIQKGETVPNEGREAGSYVWAFRNFAHADDDLIACVQGEPFTHSPVFVRELYRSPEGFKYFNGWEVECDGDGSPHHPGLPVAEKYEEWFQKPFPGSVKFRSGAQFALRGRDLKGKDWEAWYERACTEHGPWLMERFWPVIFGD